MKHILCIDPGGGGTVNPAGTGWAVLDLKGTALELDNLTPEDTYDRLNAYDRLDLVHVIYEDFIVGRGRNANKFQGSRMETTQVIGAVKSFCRRMNIKPVVQVPQNKDIGAKWSGMQPPKNHALSHNIDAYNHGFFYLRNTYNIPTALERSDWLNNGI